MIRALRSRLDLLCRMLPALLLFHATPVSAAPLPWQRPGALSLAWLGEAAPLARDRLAAWLGAEGVSLIEEASPGRGVVVKASAALELKRALEGSRRALLSASADNGARRALKKAMDEVARHADLAREIGPLWQEALALEALASWREDEKERASALVLAALAVHPRASLPLTDPWDWDEGAIGALAWERWVEAVRRDHRPLCEMRIVGARPGALVFVNGFPLGEAREVVLAAGTHRIEARDGSRWSRAEIKCERQSRVEARLEPGPRPFFRALSRRDPWLLVDTDRGDLKLFLFTPEVALDPVPLSKRWRLADATLDPVGSGVPIAADSFRELLSRHASGAPETPPSLRETGTLELETSAHATKWYNDWKFWALAGALVGGAAVVWLATREPNVHAHSGGVSLRLD